MTGRWRSWTMVMTIVTLPASGCNRAGSQAPPAAMEITRQTACALDGMLLADYPGPKAQIHYAGAATPEFFCDLVEMFRIVIAPEQVRTVRALYVQDMGKATWDEPHGYWVDARRAFFVVGSRRPGSMGPTIASFALEVDAQRFQAEHGGRVVSFDGVKSGDAVLDGGALHDSQMPEGRGRG